MNDFSQPSAITIKPAPVDADKKEKFVDRLKGKSHVKVLNVTSGVTFTIRNTATEHMETILRHGDKWMMWGTDTTAPSTLTNHELEDYLSDQFKIAQARKKKLE